MIKLKVFFSCSGIDTKVLGSQSERGGGLEFLLKSFRGGGDKGTPNNVFLCSQIIGKNI